MSHEPKSQIYYLQIIELGQVVANVATVVPGGVVVFFTSYAYEAQVFEQWTAMGTIARIERKKKVVFVC